MLKSRASENEKSKVTRDQMLWLAAGEEVWLVSRTNSTPTGTALGGSRPCGNSKVQQIPLTHCHATMCFVALCSLCCSCQMGARNF